MESNLSRFFIILFGLYIWIIRDYSGFSGEICMFIYFEACPGILTE